MKIISRISHLEVSIFSLLFMPSIKYQPHSFYFIPLEVMCVCVQHVILYKHFNKIGGVNIILRLHKPNLHMWYKYCRYMFLLSIFFSFTNTHLGVLNKHVIHFSWKIFLSAHIYSKVWHKKFLSTYKWQLRSLRYVSDLNQAMVRLGTDIRHHRQVKRWQCANWRRHSCDRQSLSNVDSLGFFLRNLETQK